LKFRSAIKKRIDIARKLIGGDESLLRGITQRATDCYEQYPNDCAEDGYAFWMTNFSVFVRIWSSNLKECPSLSGRLSLMDDKARFQVGRTWSHEEIWPFHPLKLKGHESMIDDDEDSELEDDIQDMGEGGVERCGKCKSHKVTVTHYQTRSGGMELRVLNFVSFVIIY
jgi:hypothetical protein